MDDLDDNRDPDDRQEIEGDDEIGPLLKRLRESTACETCNGLPASQAPTSP